jgi:ribosomal protein S27AE
MSDQKPTLPADVARLVIAARHVAFGDPTDVEALKELETASEAFADRIPWEDEPEEKDDTRWMCEACGASYPHEEGSSSLDGANFCPDCTKARVEAIASCSHDMEPYDEGEPGDTYCPKCGGVFPAPEAQHA